MTRKIRGFLKVQLLRSRITSWFSAKLRAAGKELRGRRYMGHRSVLGLGR